VTDADKVKILETLILGHDFDAMELCQALHGRYEPRRVDWHEVANFLAELEAKGIVKFYYGAPWKDGFSRYVLNRS